jgi:hypothetical protein
MAKQSTQIHLETALGGRSTPFQSSKTTSQTATWSEARKQADAREDALKLLLALGGAGFGAGALARGVVGVNQAASAPSYDPLMHTSSIPTPLPVPIFPAPKKKKPLELAGPPSLAKAAEALRKVAIETPAPPATPAQSPAAPPPTMMQNIANTIIPEGLPQTSPLASQWGIPASMLVAGTGLYGGWRAMGALADKAKTNNVDTAVQDAEEDYQRALAEQYRAALRAKKGEDTLGIDDLYDALTKKAEEPSFLPRIPVVSSITDAMMTPATLAFGSDNVNKFRGGVDAATIASALGAGYLTHNWVKKRNTDKILEKAVQLRARQRQFTPSPFYAVPEQLAERA